MYIPGCPPHRCEKLNCDCIMYYREENVSCENQRPHYGSPEEPRSPKGQHLSIGHHWRPDFIGLTYMIRTKQEVGHLHQDLFQLCGRGCCGWSYRKQLCDLAAILFLSSSHRRSLWTFSSVISVLWPLRYMQTAWSHLALGWSKSL